MNKAECQGVDPRMHICHVNLASDFAGGERQTVNLIRYLSDQNVEQTLIAKPDHQMISELSGYPVKIRTVRHFLLGHRRGNWDMVHCHDGKAAYWGMLQKLAHQCPYIVTRRVENPLKNKWTTRTAYSQASAVVCLSKAVKRSVNRLLPDSACPIIPSSFSGFPADPDVVQNIRDKFPGKILIGQVGSLFRIKGHHVTIEAAKILQRERSDLAFVFLGKGPELQNLKRQAVGVESVHFMGHQSDVGSWLEALDLMVFPSLQEGLGSTVLEAMQHGTPVVASNVGGIPDMIEHRKNGTLVEPENPVELAGAVSELISNPELSRSYVSCATSGLSRFSQKAVGDAYLELYKNLI